MKPTPPTENQTKFAKELLKMEAHRYGQTTAPAVVERLLKTGALHPEWRTAPEKKEEAIAHYGEGADCEVP